MSGAEIVLNIATIAYVEYNLFASYHTQLDEMNEMNGQEVGGYNEEMLKEATARVER